MGHGRRRWRVIWAAGALVLAVMVTAGVAAGERHGGLPARMLSGHGMGGAVDLAENGGRVWAITYAAHGSGSVLELNASNGRWIRTFSGGRYGFRYPDAIAAGGGHIWVANDPQTGDGQTPKPGDGSVTELNAADGSWVRTLSGRRYGFDFPGPMAVSRADVWVVDAPLVVSALVDSGATGAWAESLLTAEPLGAPHLMPAEAANILRRAAAAGDISADAASLAYADLLDLRVELFPYAPFAARTWELRDNVTCYDAWYIALAESLESRVATLDLRLARASGPRCGFETPPAAGS
jgi:predicted nucleic acid-binding protein